MGRAEVGTPKWLANKMKAKGLQKLRWYCQMCEKQCRDENGFKCHRMSESHQRQMQVFSQHPDRFMDDFSREFESSFMKLMKTRYCRTRILANTVYTEMIAHREHIHMNSTIWVTLSEFVQYLGQSGKCQIDLTPKGWYLEYIDREKLEREKQERNKLKNERSIEEMNERRINALIEKAKEAGSYEKPDSTKFERLNDTKVTLKNFQMKPELENTSGPQKKNIFLEFIKNTKKSENKDTPEQKDIPPDRKRKISAIDQIILQNEERKKIFNDPKDKGVKSKYPEQPESNEIGAESIAKKSECWLSPGLIIKIIDKKDKEYYKSKAEIIDVFQSKNQARVKLLNDSSELLIDQDSIETVIPSIGGAVRVVLGKLKGLEGILHQVDHDTLLAKIKVYDFDENPEKIVNDLQLEEICKFSKP